MKEDPRPHPAPIEVVDTEEVRVKYNEEQLEEAVRKAERAKRDQQEQVLLDLVDSERLDFGDLLSMLRLGIIAHDPDFLPCHDWRRSYNSGDWDIQYEDHLVQLKEGGRPLTDKEWKERYPERSVSRLTPAMVSCPIMSHIFYRDEPLPCIEAQQEQLRSRETWNKPLRPDHELPRLLDPDDPVVGCELRPCNSLANVLLLSLFTRIYKRKHPNPAAEIDIGPLTPRRKDEGKG